MKRILIALLIAGSACSTAYSAVRFEFVQSQAIASPAATGLWDGLLLQAPTEKNKWPTDIMPSVAESKIARTPLAMQYSVDHAYPSYALWVRIGNTITVTLGTLLLVLVILARRVGNNA